MGVTAFIPAKMTSQRLPKKNMRELCGRPLLYYSIRAAQLAAGVDEAVVSSESSEVLDYAASQGAAIHRRSPELERPEVRNVEVLREWYLALREKPDLVALLQPTHPLRDPEDLSVAIEAMHRDPEADSLFTVIAMADLLGAIEGGCFVPEVPLPRNRNAEPKRFKNTGSFYLFRPERTFLTDQPYGRRIRAYEMQQPAWEVDIDHEYDLIYAEALLRSQPELLEKYS